MYKKLLSLSFLSLALCSTFAHAYESGDLILRAGAIGVDPHEDSEKLELAGRKVNGTGATVDSSDIQLGLTGTFMFTNHLGVGLLAATPFTHDIGVKGLGPLSGKLGDVKQLPPTLTLQYFPMDSASKFQPYIGAGINYTTFFDADLTGKRKREGFSNLDLDDSIGFAAEIGMDYAITDHIVLNANIWYLDIDTKATTNLAGVGKVKVDVDVDPWVYMVGLGYKF